MRSHVLPLQVPKGIPLDCFCNEIYINYEMRQRGSKYLPIMHTAY